jgi:hypothetical protein
MSDNWQDLPRTVAVDRYIARPNSDLPEPEPDEPRKYKRGTPFTDQEIANFRQRGGGIDYCPKRLAKQDLNDQRAAERKDIRPFGRGLDGHPLDVIDIAIDACASAWDADKYMASHRATVQQILDQPRNARRRKLAGMPSKHRRHQKALRLVHALAFDRVMLADYCRQHKLDKADASRMLAHLYEKESGLADAIGAISACAAGIFWQNRQQKSKVASTREGAREASQTRVRVGPLRRCHRALSESSLDSVAHDARRRGIPAPERCCR